MILILKNGTFVISMSRKYKLFTDCPNRLFMVRRSLKIFLIFLTLILTYQAKAQSKRLRSGEVKNKYFQIPGRVKLEKGDPDGAVVNLFNLDTKQIEKSITVPSSGKFDLDLSYFNEYRISITREGYYEKQIDVSTVVPRNIWEKDSVFPPFYIVVVLFKVFFYRTDIDFTKSHFLIELIREKCFIAQDNMFGADLISGG